MNILLSPRRALVAIVLAAGAAGSLAGCQVDPLAPAPVTPAPSTEFVGITPPMFCVVDAAHVGPVDCPGAR